jgi:hypothetical protein
MAASERGRTAVAAVDPPDLAPRRLCPPANPTREERVQKSGLLGSARAANPQLRAVEALLAAASGEDPFCLYLRGLVAIDRWGCCVWGVSGEAARPAPVAGGWHSRRCC